MTVVIPLDSLVVALLFDKPSACVKAGSLLQKLVSWF
jgi:hypothetical protein